jgi:hypothetical protein
LFGLVPAVSFLLLRTHVIFRDIAILFPHLLLCFWSGAPSSAFIFYRSGRTTAAFTPKQLSSHVFAPQIVVFCILTLLLFLFTLLFALFKDI